MPAADHRAFYAAGIARIDLTAPEYDRWITSPFLDGELGPNGTALVIVHGRPERIPSPGSLPMVVCAVGDEFGGYGPLAADVVVSERDLDDLTARVASAPIAAVTLATLLRAVPHVGPDVALALESAAYSTLQAGPEFATWRSVHPVGTPPADDGPTVSVGRDGDVLRIVLDRPARHNAISARLRDDLYEALALAVADDTIRRVELRGNGPSFCSGGDLAEFGSRPDPATAHTTRLARSPARLLHLLGERVVAHVHGATLGGGAELAAFCGRVVAAPGTRFALPEIGLGLIPGAGGTVSLTRRIGRQRTAALGLTGRAIDAGTALAWGLVDDVSTARPA